MSGDFPAEMVLTLERPPVNTVRGSLEDIALPRKRHTRPRICFSETAARAAIKIGKVWGIVPAETELSSLLRELYARCHDVTYARDLVPSAGMRSGCCMSQFHALQQALTMAP